MEVDPLWEEFREQVAVWSLDGRNGNISKMRGRMACLFDLQRVCIWCGCDLPKDLRRQWCTDKLCGQQAYQRYNWDSKRRRFLWHKDGMPVACARCEVNCAETVHHILPISDGGNPYDEDNLIALCSDCHLEAHRKINAQKDTKANRKRKKKAAEAAEKAEQDEKEAVMFAETVQQHDEYWAQFGGIV